MVDAEKEGDFMIAKHRVSNDDNILMCVSRVSLGGEYSVGCYDMICISLSNVSCKS